jgi:phospholipase/carboxylesterase
MPLHSSPRVTRRRFGAIAGGALASFAFGGACHGTEIQVGGDGRLTVRARTAAANGNAESGSRPLKLDDGRDAIVQVPANASGTRLPLLVLLHGAGGSGSGILRRLGSAADEASVAVLAPDSRDATWDAIRGDFGPDVRFLNRALERIFDTLSIDPARVSVGGFSDGATYALSLGLINGDLFRRVLAFSPGFIIGDQQRGKPRVFVSHGTSDPILPIDRCSRVIVPGLKKLGYDVTFREFTGGHTVPAEIAREGMRWVAGA